MMRRHATYFLLAVFGLTALTTIGYAAIIPVPNGNFETHPPDPNVDGDNDYATGDISPPWSGDNLRRNTNEAFTRPSTFQLGWQSNGPADTDDGLPIDDGKFGLQQPRSGSGTNQLYYQRTQPAGAIPTGDLMGSFNGNLIGFMNMDDIDGFDQEIQSGILGNLKPGVTYTLTVAVGARAGQASWNDIKYDVMLVSNPTPGDGTNSKHGSNGGTILGTPASLTMVVLGAQPNTTNIQDLTYTFRATTSDPFAIRIATHNAFTQNGVPDPGAPVNGGTNARFTQANFDNVRLSIPEPGSLGLAFFGSTLGLTLAAARRRA